MNKTKILLVDDEVDFLKVMSMRMRDWEYGVVTASNAEEAIRVLKSDKPDVVILDYKMPDKDGVEVLKEIRNIDDKIPVIMFTAHPDEKSIKGAEKLGVSFYIPKLSAYSNAHANLKAAIDMVEKRMCGREGSNG